MLNTLKCLLWIGRLLDVSKRLLYGAVEDNFIRLGYCFHEVSFFIDQCVDFAFFRTAFLFLR